MMNNERKNSKTLMEYVNTHSRQYVKDSNKTMYFTVKNLKCDILDSIKEDDIKNVYIPTANNYYIFLNDNSYLSFSANKLFSNEQNCIKIDSNINIKDIKQYENSYYFVDEKNKVYSVRAKNYELELLEPTEFVEYVLSKDDIISVINNISSVREYEFIVLKKDNSLYKQTYKLNGKFTLIDEEIFISNKEYGNILNATMKYNFEDKKYEIDTLLTDKGYYYGEVQTEECTKYQDIKCERKISESEIYKKYNKNIKYINDKYTLLSDNFIIETRYLTYPLDKDLK